MAHVCDELIEAEAEIEQLRAQLADIEARVREHEPAWGPIAWADRPDIYWCQRCDHYHRTDYEGPHRREDGGGRRT